jgi:hypothetical protein
VSEAFTTAADLRHGLERMKKTVASFPKQIACLD